MHRRSVRRMLDARTPHLERLSSIPWAMDPFRARASTPRRVANRYVR